MSAAAAAEGRPRERRRRRRSRIETAAPVVSHGQPPPLNVETGESTLYSLY
jgi:hypothetical protein